MNDFNRTSVDLGRDLGVKEQSTIDRDLVEQIADGGCVLAIVLRAALSPERTTFVTPDDYRQQVGFVVYEAGGEVKRHVHKPIARSIVGTSEVVIVREGCCEVDIYNDNRELVAMRELSTGDVMIMVSGGHGFRMLEDTVLLEVKQGPYTGIDEKERF